MLGDEGIENVSGNEKVFCYWECVNMATCWKLPSLGGSPEVCQSRGDLFKVFTYWVRELNTGLKFYILPEIKSGCFTEVVISTNEMLMFRIYIRFTGRKWIFKQYAWQMLSLSDTFTVFLVPRAPYSVSRTLRTPSAKIIPTVGFLRRKAQ